MMGQHRGIIPRAIPDIHKAIEMIIHKYPRTRCGWEHRKTDMRLQNIVESLNRKATPGYPIRSVVSNNGQLLMDPMMREHAFAVAEWRLDQLSQIDPVALETALAADPLFAVRNGLADVKSTILKDEPHPQRKVVRFLWRYVMAESLPDQVNEKQCFSNQDSAEIASWRDIPSKPGMGLTDVDAVALVAYAKRHGLNYLSDAHGWDNSVAALLMDADIEMRIRLCIDPHPEWVRAIRNINVLSKHRVMMLSDGTLLVRNTPGGMASGRKVTSSSNSRMRALIGALAGVKFGYTADGMYMGDDSFEFVPETVDPREVETYLTELTGVRLSDARRATWEDFEFCSQKFVTEGGKTIVYPLNPDKSLLRMLATTAPVDDDQVRDNLAQYFRHLPEKPLFVAAVDAIIAGRSTGPETNKGEILSTHVEERTEESDDVARRC